MQRFGRWFREKGGWLLGAVLLAAVVRLGYISEARRDPSFAFPATDAALHDYWAKALSSGDWTAPPGSRDPLIRQTPYFRPPGYPFFLGAVYWLAGSDPLVPRVAQMLLGLVTVGLAFYLGGQLYGRAVGFAFALLMGGYWVFPYFEAQLLEPSLLVYLTVLMLLALASWLETPRGWKAAGAGLCLGLHALVRPNILLFAALLPLWIAWLARRRPGQGRRLLGLLAAAWGVAAATILPAAIRNYAVARDRALICTNAGINLRIGNNPQADGLFNEPEEAGPFRSPFDWPDVVARVEQRLGGPLRHSEVSRYFGRLAVDFMREHPRRTLRLAARKTLLFWGPLEIGNNKEDHFERLHSTVLRSLPGNFALALALGLVGLAFRRRTGREGETAAGKEFLPLALLYVLAIYASHVPFFAAGRFRVPVIPVLLLYAAYAIVAWIRLLQRGRQREAAVWLGVTLAAYVLAGVNWAGYQPQEANYHYFRGLALSQAGRNADALESLGAALRLRPAHPPTLRLAARMLIEEGRPGQAAATLDLLLRLDPDDVDALYRMGMLLGQAKQYEKAELHFARAAERAPDRAEVLGAWAVTLGQLQRFPEAAATAERALAVGESMPDAFRRDLRERLERYKAGRAYDEPER